MKNTLNLSTAASPWAASRERFGIAPIAPLQGSGLPAARSFAGYVGADAPTAMTAADPATAQHGTTLVAVRKDDARVPEPRGRQR